MKPQPFSVGVFSCPIAPVPACCWGFLRKPADYAGQPLNPFRATFHSLLAIPRSDLAAMDCKRGALGITTIANEFANVSTEEAGE